MISVKGFCSEKSIIVLHQRVFRHTLSHTPYPAEVNNTNCGMISDGFGGFVGGFRTSLLEFPSISI